MATGKLLTRDSLVSMQVIDSNAKLVGKVSDVAFEIGKTGLSLAVETSKGEMITVQWSEIQAASDFILLKPQSSQIQNATQDQTQQPQQQTQQKLTKQKTPPLCPVCNKPLTWIPQYNRYYCYG